MTSLEPWDDIWRRNQHFASRLVISGAVDSLVFVTPPAGGFALRTQRHSPLAGIEVVTPPLLIPRRFGGHRLLASWLRRALADIDVLWVNDPVAGVGALRPGLPAVYDVTDDWREMPQSAVDRARIVAAEDILAGRAETVVCSEVLAERWMSRYKVPATVIQNGVDAAAIRDATIRVLDGQPPHAVYVGTLHSSRFDVDLVVVLATAWRGTVHLVGPDNLGSAERDRLHRSGARLHGSVPARDVPSWLASADLLFCPHVVDEFTLSLDAIKSHEYLATPHPVVATASSGFQSLTAPGLAVVDRSAFVGAAVAAVGSGPFARRAPTDWAVRADQFAAVLQRAGS